MPWTKGQRMLKSGQGGMAPSSQPYSPTWEDLWGGDGDGDGDAAAALMLSLLQIRTTTRSFLVLWTMPSLWRMPSGCSSGTGAVLRFPSSTPCSPFGTAPQFPMLSPQWHFRGAAAAAVLPVGGHVAERDLHSTLWLWLLLEHPRPMVLHHCAGAA